MRPYSQIINWLAKQYIVKNLINETLFPKITHFRKVTLIDASVSYNIGNGSKECDKYNEFQPHLAYEISDIKGTKQSLCTKHIWLAICLKALDSINKWICFSMLFINLVKQTMPETYSKRFSHRFNERWLNHIVETHINLQLINIYFNLKIV